MMTYVRAFRFPGHTLLVHRQPKLSLFSTYSLASTTSSSSHVDAILSCVIGGLALHISILGFLVFWFFRCRRQPTRARPRAPSDFSACHIHGTPVGVHSRRPW